MERAQGLTVELVVVSLCASAPDFVAASANFLFSPNRLNVAVSRARAKVVLLAEANTTRLGERGNTWGRLLAEAETVRHQ